LMLRLLLHPPHTSPLLPYTTLFRSSLTCDPPSRGRALGFSHALVCQLSGRSPCRTQGGSVTARWRASAATYGSYRRRSSASCRADRKSTRLNSSHVSISYAVFCLKK